MSSDSVLIVDDTPVNLKLVKVLLTRQGFDVRTASTAEEALEVARSFRPRLVLADIQLPGMDGLEMTRHLKSDPATRETVVLALTAFAMKGDEQKAFDAGCDGYITKPIDTRTLPTLIRQYLNGSAGAARVVQSTSLPEPAVSVPCLPELQQAFLAEGIQQSGRLITALGSNFDHTEVLNMAHRWAGTGGSIGYPQISQQARELETQLQQNAPVSLEETRHSLVGLARLFAESIQQDPQEQHKTLVEQPQAVSAPSQESLSPALLDALAGKRFALIGFAPEDAGRLSAALTQLQAFSRELASDPHPNAAMLQPFDIVLQNVRSAIKSPPQCQKPMLLVGSREILLRSEQPVHNSYEDFLFSPWTVEDAILRSYLVMSRVVHVGDPRPATGGNAKPRVLVADDDSTIRALVETTVRNLGFECRVASNGDEALELIQSWHPDAAVLDVKMPNQNGLQVLSSIRNDPLTKGVRVILLTALQRETDVIRGFGLGADDYVIKPFSPMELSARLKRLLQSLS